MSGPGPENYRRYTSARMLEVVPQLPEGFSLAARHCACRRPTTSTIVHTIQIHELDLRLDCHHHVKVPDPLRSHGSAISLVHQRHYEQSKMRTQVDGVQQTGQAWDGRTSPSRPSSRVLHVSSGADSNPTYTINVIPLSHELRTPRPFRHSQTS